MEDSIITSIPKVSVVIPTFNRARYIKETIDSVLAQTYRDYEVIVVDDGSTDNTRDIIKGYNGKIRYIYQENKGTAAARNVGIKNSRGEYIAFLDDDDLWLPEKLERQITCIEEGMGLGFVCSGSYVIDASGKVIKTWLKSKCLPDTFEVLFERNYIYNLTVLARKYCIDTVGGFDEHLVVSQDYDLWLRLAKKFEFKYINEPLAKYRLHNKNTSYHLPIRMRDNINLINKKEISGDFGYFRKYIRITKAYYYFGEQFLLQLKYFDAGRCYLKAILRLPFIGMYYHPKPIPRFSRFLPQFILRQRILNPYFLLLISILKSSLVISASIKTTLINVFVKHYSILCSYVFNISSDRKSRIGFLVEEFFHSDLRGFGGFGKTVKNITSYFNASNRTGTSVLLTQGFTFVKKPHIGMYHGTKVLLRPNGLSKSLLYQLRYINGMNSLRNSLFISMEYYPSYEAILNLSPSTPLLIWIRDPRCRRDWERISSVGLELLQRNRDTKEELTKLADEKRISLQRVIKSSCKRRKIIFATNAHCLVDRAKETYGLCDMNPYYLPNPIPLPNINEIEFSEKPSFCFIGRLDPVKRPWIYFELAKIFPNVDFYVAGETSVPHLMNSRIDKYRSVSNLNFLGLVDDETKDRLLKQCWALVNTSVHESLPVSFLESFSYGKQVISCQNPDGLTEKFGYYTGESVGNGFDQDTLNKFSKAIEKAIAEKNKLKEKGILAMEYIAQNHSFDNFNKKLTEILRKEGIRV